MSTRQKAISGVKWTTLSSVFSAVVSIARIAILARLLDKSVFGLIAIVMFILGISRLFMDMGVSVAILHRQNITDNEYSSLYCFNLILGGVLFAIITLIAPWVAQFYGEPELLSVVPIMAFTILLAVIGLQHKVIERKELNFKFIEIVEITANIIAFVVAVVLAYMGHGVYALVYSALAQFLFSNVIYTIRGLRSRKYTLRLKKAELKPFLSIGAYQMAGQFLNYFSSQMDTLLIGKLLGMNILGGYNLAKSLAGRPMGIINPIVNKVAAPVLAQMQNNEQKMQSSFLRLIKILALINFPIYFGAAALSNSIIEVLYGTPYLEYSIVFMWMCFYMLLRSLGNPVGSIITAKGRTDLDFYWNILVLLSMPLTIWVTIQFNINIVALGLFLLMFLYTFISFYMVIRKVLTISLWEYIGQFKYPLLLSSIMFVVVLVINILISNSLLSLIIGTSVGAITYLFMSYILGLKIDKELFSRFYALPLAKKLSKLNIKPL